MSKVVQDLPHDAIVGGNPAQLLRIRFPPHVVTELLEMAGGYWDKAKIARNLDKIIAKDWKVLRNYE